MTLQQWQREYGRRREMVERFQKLVNARARKLAREAGLDPSIAGLHAHNALVSLEYGQPWPEVDYRKARKVNWLLSDYIWRASRVLERWSNRVWPSVTFGREA